MKISEVTTKLIKQYAVIENDDDDTLIENVFMPAAKSYIMSYTGHSFDEIDNIPELAIAYMALCAFMYDNRSMSITNDNKNAVIESFIGAHDINLVG